MVYADDLFIWDLIMLSNDAQMPLQEFLDGAYIENVKIWREKEIAFEILTKKKEKSLVPGL